jgi:hypothetical protein
VPTLANQGDEYEYMGNLGDASPLEHGGFLVYRHKETGAVEVEIIEFAENDGEADEHQQETYDQIFQEMSGAIHGEIPDVAALDMEESDSLVQCLKDHFEGDIAIWTVSRVQLDKCRFVHGILSDNPSHPELPAWFAKPERERAERPQDTTYFRDLCKSMDVSEADLISQLCSDDAMERARGYNTVIGHHGVYEFDQYPVTFHFKKEMKQRYKAELET